MVGRNQPCQNIQKGVLDPVKIALLCITCFYERANHGVAADPQFPHPEEAPPLPLLSRLGAYLQK